MATQSFYEDLIVDTPDKAERIVNALKKADLKSPKEYSCKYYELLEESDRILLEKNSS